MNRYFMYLAYNGTRFCGWQNQPNGLSVQQCIEEALATINRVSVPTVGAGRTDAGVHARLMVAHFDVENPISDIALWVEKLNRLLPPDIAIQSILPVRRDAHARFDALSRTYQYYITHFKNPFDYEWVCRMALNEMDFDQMNKACHILMEYQDFTSFSKLHTDTKTNLCRIDRAEWKNTEHMWTFTIQADRFLRNMVRAVVGTLFEVGRHKYSLDDFRRIIKAKDRCRAGTSVPGKGLSLIDVAYPEDIFLI